MIEGRSLTRSEQDALIDYQAEHELEAKSNRLSKLQIEWAKSFKTDRDAEMLAGLQKSLETAREKLYEKVANDPTKFKHVKPQLQAIADQLRDLDVEREQLEQDPAEVVVQVNSVSQEQRELNREIDDIGLGSAHLLAKLRGDTSEEFDAWKERATLKDYENAWAVQKLGNAVSKFGETPQPLSNEQRRRIELNRILN